MSDTNLNNASFTPEIQDSEESTNKQTYAATGSFRFWCQKVLPLVYDDSLSYYELLCKVVNYLNSVIQNVDNLNTSVDNTNTAFNNLQNYVNTTKDTLVEVYSELEKYVNDYFNNLDVQAEINSKLDSMAVDGSLSTIISPFIPSAVSAWLAENITPTSPPVDNTLSITGAAADAKVTGDNMHASIAYPVSNPSAIVVDPTNRTITLKANSGFVWDGGSALSGNSDIVYNETVLTASTMKVYINSETKGLTFIWTGDSTPLNKNLGMLGFIDKSDFSFRSITLAMQPNDKNTLIKRLIDDTLTKRLYAADAYSVGNNVHASIAFPTNTASKLIVDAENKTITLKANSSFVWDGNSVISGGSDITYGTSDLPSSVTKIFFNKETAELEFMSVSDATPINKNLGLLGLIVRSSFAFMSASNAINPWYNNLTIVDTLRKPSIITYSGLLSLTACGNKIIIDCFAFRSYNIITDQYSSALSGTFYLDGDYSTRYIDFVNNNFVLSTTITQYSIAVYRKLEFIIPLIDNIICGHRLPMDGYVRSGHKYNINLKKLGINGYIGYNGSTEIKYSKTSYGLVAGTHVAYVENGTDIMSNKTFTINENTADIANKKVLMIGDSFVARGYLQHFLNEFEPTLQFIGTHATQNYGYMSEGISGSRLYYFTDAATSPFYFNGALDFAQYLSANNLSAPDIVVINSAINHSSYDTAGKTYLQQLIELITMIRNYSTSIKIYVTHGANYALDEGSTYGIPNNRYNVVMRCINSVYDPSVTDNATIIPVFEAMDDKLDYTYGSVNYFDSTINVLTDCVHPAEGTGFKKIAEQIYNYLGA